MKKYILCYFLLFLFCCSTLTAQEQRIDMQFLSVENGLSSRRVNSLCQSPDGFIWLATEYGLNRYDGQYFKVFTQKTHNLLRDNIQKVFATKDNLLWLFYGQGTGSFKEMGTWSYKGLNIFDIEEEKLIPVSDVLSRDGVLPSGFRGGYNDEEGNLWLWTKHGEVFFYDGEWNKKIALPGKNAIDCVIPAKEGGLWLSYEKKIVRLEESGNILEEHQLSFYVEQLYEDQSGGLWLSSFHLRKLNKWEKAYLYYKKKGEPVEIYTASDKNSIIEDRSPSQYNSVRIDKKERIWVHRENDLELIDPISGQLISFKEKTQAISDSRHFSEFYFGQDDLIFLGSDEGFFIIELEPNLFQTYINDQSPTISTRAILDYKKDSLLVLTYGNTFTIHKENGGVRALPEFEKYNYYGAIIAADSQVWMGSHAMHITRMDPQTEATQVYYFEEPPSIYRSTLRPFQDLYTGRIWLGCSKGMAYYDMGTEFIQVFDPGSAFPEFDQQAVNGFYQNKKGLWICTTNGLYLYQEKQGIVTNFNHFPYANINHIYEDENQVFWLSTLGGGIIRWDQNNNEIRQFTTEEGLSNDVVYAAFEDDYQQLWLPSNNGLMHFDKASHDVTTYLPFDGINHEEFNNTSYCQTSDGQLYFGGINGIIGFDPKIMVDRDMAKANLIVTDFKKSNKGNGRLLDAKKEFDATQKINIYPGESSFQLHYALLDYKGKQQIKYAYKIEGIDEDWVYTSENFVLIYRLPFGSYTLRIKGQGGGKWSAKDLTIPLHVIKPLHREIWFIVLVALVAFSLGGYLVRWRIRFLQNEKMLLEQEVRRRTEQIKEQNKELEAMNDTKDQFFGIIAHDLRGPMLSFRGLNKKFRYLIANKQEDRLEELDKSVESAYQRLERLLDNLLKWALVQKGTLPFYPESLELHDFTNEIIALYLELATIHEITIVNEIAKPTMAFADADALSSVFRNLLNNAIKFSGKQTQIIISASKQEGMMQCVVSDQGTGIEEEDLETLLDFDPQKRKRKSEKGGTGLGLQLCKELVELHGGRLSVASQLGKGTTVSFFIPHENG